MAHESSSASYFKRAGDFVSGIFKKGEAPTQQEAPTTTESAPRKDTLPEEAKALAATLKGLLRNVRKGDVRPFTDEETMSLFNTFDQFANLVPDDKKQQGTDTTHRTFLETLNAYQEDARNIQEDANAARAATFEELQAANDPQAFEFSPEYLQLSEKDRERLKRYERIPLPKKKGEVIKEDPIEATKQREAIEQIRVDFAETQKDIQTQGREIQDRYLRFLEEDVVRTARMIKNKGMRIPSETAPAGEEEAEHVATVEALRKQEEEKLKIQRAANATSTKKRSAREAILAGMGASEEAEPVRPSTRRMELDATVPEGMNEDTEIDSDTHLPTGF